MLDSNVSGVGKIDIFVVCVLPNFSRCQILTSGSFFWCERIQTMCDYDSHLSHQILRVTFRN